MPSTANQPDRHHARVVIRHTRCLSTILLIVAISLTSTSPSLAQEGATAEPSSFILGVGDVLSITIWKSPDLTSSVQIQPDGRISLPLIDEVPAAGRTISDLRNSLTESYKRFVTSPSVSVVVTEINSRKIYVVGEVQSPGEFDLLRPMTLMQAIAKAGGFTEFAQKDEIVVLRAQTRTVVSFKRIISGRDPGENVELEPDDTIVVP